MRIYAILGAVAVVASLISAMLWYRGEAIEAKADLTLSEERLQSAQTALDWAEAQRQKEQAIGQRAEQQKAEIEREADKNARKFREIINRLKGADRDWARGVVPDSVVDGMRPDPRLPGCPNCSP